MKIPRTPLKFLWYISSRYKTLGVVSLLLVLTAEIANILIFYVSAQLVERFTQAGSTVEQTHTVVYWGGLFLALYAAHLIFYRLSGYTLIYWIIKFHQDGYNILYGYLTKHSHTYFSDRFAGALSNKVSNAMDSSAGLMFQIVWTFFSEFIGLVVTLVLFFSVAVRIGLILLFITLAVFVFNILAVRRRRPYVVRYAESASKSRGEGVDVISNISAVRLFSQHENELQRLAGFFTERSKRDVKQSFFGENIMVVNTLFAILMTAMILGTLYLLMREEAISVGVFVLVLGLLGRVGHLFITTGQALNRFIREYGNIEEGLKEILLPHTVTDSNEAKTLSVSTGKIDFKKVLFSHESVEVFNNFTLAIPAGQRLGLVGPSGAGKSTFVSLLLRQYDIESGSIDIDGQNIATVTQDSLRAAIAVVPQEPALFHRTIRENIAYGKPDATLDEIIDVAKKAYAHDFIAALPLGYDTLVGERGVKLSGGQKQRIAIARAMLKNAPILVLDEATSALDSESEVEIQKALHILMSGKTVIAIAHRLSTLREMDRIIVLENGAIAEDGTHDTLLTYGGTYARLWAHQAGGFLED